MKKTMFFENAKLLYDRFGIIPLMYGSLGLEYITNENLKVYRASAKDGYRITVREKKDNDKIAFIEKRLKIKH